MPVHVSASGKRRMQQGDEALKRRRQQQQRRRKKEKVAEKAGKADWVAALRRKYVAKSAATAGKKRLSTATNNSAAAKKKKNAEDDVEPNIPKRKKRSRRGRWDGPGDEEDDEVMMAEVQGEIDEKAMEKLNERQPLDTQLFLTGVPLNCVSEDITQLFARFGKLRRVHLVLDAVTKHPNGSAFVHFASKEGADSAFDHAQQNARELATAEKADFDTQVTGGGGASPAGSSSGTSGSVSRHRRKMWMHKLKHQRFTMKEPFVMIQQTRVGVHRVVSRAQAEEEAGALKKKDKKDRTKTGAEDPRNLYLLQEGVVVPGTPAAEGLPPRYLAMLQASYEQRRGQLRNVNMFVSRTRLSIRNIPRHLSEPEVRKLLLKYTRKYYKANPDQLDRAKFGKHGPLKNLKLMIDANGQPKGFGFAEFAQHEAALHVLRMLNNNPTIFGSHHRLVLAFAVENQNALQKMERLRELRKMKAAKPKSLLESKDDEEDAAPTYQI